MSDMLPHVTVVIPTYNRPERLALCLHALALQDYPRDRFDVVVVNDGGVDPEPVLASGCTGVRLTVVHQRNAGPAAARNAGALQATGTVLAFTDDDCAPAAGWLRALAHAVADEPSCLAGGRTLNALQGVLYAEASQLLIDYLYDYYDGSTARRGRFFASNNFALSRAAFSDLGGFDRTFPTAAGEDRDFCDRWLHSGRTMRYTADAIVLHAHDMKVRGYWRQHHAYGAAARRFHQLRAERGQLRPAVEPLSFYTRLVLYPLGNVPLRRALPLSALLLLSQVANVAGYASARWRRIDA